LCILALPLTSHRLVETGKATDSEVARFRLLTPLLKLYAGREAIAVVSECLEALGGLGYMEVRSVSLAVAAFHVLVC
jgi:alkylation response protein AidB-like acyl-CoA dehydrogenase